MVSFLFQISKLLVVHPKGRLTAEQALEHAWFQGAQVCYLDCHRERKLCFNMYDVLIAYPVLFITIFIFLFNILICICILNLQQAKNDGFSARWKFKVAPNSFLIIKHINNWCFHVVVNTGSR